MARFCPLFSGSSGNCLYIGSADGGILVDAGVSARRIEKALAAREAEAALLARVEEVRNFLCSYQLCADMLKLRRYERKRAKPFLDPCECDDVLKGSERFWRARMFSVGALIGSMPNGREKLLLHYHYVHGESIEHIADVLDVSRRTGYRIHEKALLRAAGLYAAQKSKINASV